MPLLQISVTGRNLRLHGSPQAVRPALQAALGQTKGPVTYLLHGLKYAPGYGDACPHTGLFAHNAVNRGPKVISWPKHLDPGGLVIGVGWPARGVPWTVYARAAEAGIALGDLARMVHVMAPGRPQHVLAHSLGARVALQALHHAPVGAFASQILLAAAEYRSAAEDALATRAGRAAEILHVTSGENDMYDFLFERSIAPPNRRDRAVGTHPLSHGRTLLLDDGDALSGLARLGFRIAPPARRICHWSPYLRPGVFPLYRALIRGDLEYSQLDRVLQHRPRRRWSRLVTRLPAPSPLPMAQDASL